MAKSKLQREYQADDDGTVLVERDALPPLEITPTALKQTVRRPMSEAQKANMARLIEANKQRWSALRESKAKQAEEEKARAKAEADQKIQAGTHVRVKVKEKAVYTKKPKELVTTRSEREPSEKPRITYISEDEDETTEYSSDDEPPKREKKGIHKEVKRTVRSLERINTALKQAAPQNPYLANLMTKWK